MELLKLNNAKSIFDKLRLSLRRSPKDKRIEILSEFQADIEIKQFSDYLPVNVDLQNICTVDKIEKNERRQSIKCENCSNYTKCNNDIIGIVAELSSGKIKLNVDENANFTDIFPESKSLLKDKEIREKHIYLLNLDGWNKFFY
jgi:hypothetical protein